MGGHSPQNASGACRGAAEGGSCISGSTTASHGGGSCISGLSSASPSAAALNPLARAGPVGDSVKSGLPHSLLKEVLTKFIPRKVAMSVRSRSLCFASNSFVRSAAWLAAADALAHAVLMPVDTLCCTVAAVSLSCSCSFTALALALVLWIADSVVWPMVGNLPPPQPFALLRCQ